MRYDAECKKIIIGCREFVNTARRGISSNVVRDDCEPEALISSKRIYKLAIPDAEQKKLTLDFELSGSAFSMEGVADKAEGEKITVSREIDSNPDRPKKEYQKDLRGLGFVLAYMYAIEKNLDCVSIKFIYINSELERWSESEELVSIKKLTLFFEKCKGELSLYAKPEIERVTERLPSMKSLCFPYKEIRSGQDLFIKKAYKTIARGGTLFATAPTGTGKTISAIYPAVRALGDGRIDKIFYLTPKETTANAAIECFETLHECGADIRVLKLTAKEKACTGGLVCRESASLCKNSKTSGLKEAVLYLYEKKLTVALVDDITEAAKRYSVCPYELSLSYAELCDAVICDFNYLFDPRVYIRRFFTEGGNFAFLIDEAHNLPDRAREMFSAEISESDISMPNSSEIIGAHSSIKSDSILAAEIFREELYPILKEDIIKNEDGEAVGFSHVKEIPYKLFELFDRLILGVEDEIYKNLSAKDEEKEKRLKLLYTYYYKLKNFRSVMQSFDSSYEMFIFFEGGEVRAKLFAVDPGREISKRLEKGKASIFFSATLTPLYYYKSVLGGDGSSETLTVDSPFDPSQLSVSIMDNISTRFSERDDTLNAVCRAIAATVSAKRGNYMIFSPSFQYSEALCKVFSAMYPKIKILSQKRNMTNKEKEDFLSEFSRTDGKYLIGFCVMGGIYAEGIDLVGDSLIGAVIVGIGMPSLSYEREALTAYYDEKYEEGKQFAYIYPGMNRVLQAAGRVIRREDDKGVIVLIDDRFDDPIYKKVIPKLWSDIGFYKSPKELKEALDEFWQKK